MVKIVPVLRVGKRAIKKQKQGFFFATAKKRFSCRLKLLVFVFTHCFVLWPKDSRKYNCNRSDKTFIRNTNANKQKAAGQFKLYYNQKADYAAKPNNLFHTTVPSRFIII